MYVRPFKIAIQCSLGLAAGAAPRSRPTPALKNKSSHDERTARTQRSRKRSVSFALRRAERHVGAVGAREAATENPDERGQTRERIWGSEGERRARVRRGRFSGSRHGRGNGVRKGGQPCPGFAGSRWVREVGTFVRGRERKATNGECVGERRRSVRSCLAALSTGGGRRALQAKERTERPRAARSTPAPNLSPRRPRDTQGGRGKRRREAERGSLGVSMGILPGGSR